MNLRSLLVIFNPLYSLLIKMRNKLYDCGIINSYKSQLPIISIGNLTCGGNGKTPFAIYLANALMQQNIKPVILTRGYGGRISGPILVNSQHTSEEVGDEPLMMFKALQIPVIVARNRRMGAKFIEQSGAGDVIILDDGFQHRRLKRNLDLVLVDVSADNWQSQYQANLLLPAGNFRESLVGAAARIGAVVLVNRALSAIDWALQQRLAESIPAFKDKNIFTAQVKAEGVYSLGDSSLELEKQEVFIFSAIANPASFIKSVKALGYKVCGLRTFRDHYAFTAADIEDLRREAKGLPLICTEKDAVKLQEFARQNFFCLKISMESNFKLAGLLDLNPTP